ncbi:alpha/beta fold hydrolase [Streptomyces sp. NPDC055103]
MRLASRPGGAEAMLEILGSLRGVHEPWRRELLTEVAAMDLPLLVVWGDHDRILPARHLDAARAAFPKARTHLFTATGHMPQIERAEDFADLARDFWA